MSKVNNITTANTTTGETTKTGETTATGDTATTNGNNTQTTTDTTTQSNTTTQEKSLTKADVDAAVKKAQKDWEKQLKEAEAKAKLSEEERKNAEIEDLKTQIKERDARDTVASEATKLGVKNPSLVYRLVKDDLEFDDKGKISNLKDVFDAAKTDYPELFDNKPSGSIDAGAGGGSETKPEDEVSAAFKKTGRTNSFRL